MTTYAVTGATGQLGALVIDALLGQDTSPADIVAIVRNPAKAAGLRERGISIRQADYAEPRMLAAALAGVDNLLLISGSEVGQRVAQHTNVVEAAQAAAVRRIAYTSVLRADTTALALAPEHKATEAVVRDSGIEFTFLRNGWDTENYTGQLGAYLQSGAVVVPPGTPGSLRPPVRTSLPRPQSP